MRTQRSRLRNNPKPHPNRISGWPLCPSLLRWREKKGWRGRRWRAGAAEGKGKEGQEELCGVGWPASARSGEWSGERSAELCARASGVSGLRGLWGPRSPRCGGY